MNFEIFKPAKKSLLQLSFFAPMLELHTQIQIQHKLK
jgi:hypothetical protein